MKKIALCALMLAHLNTNAASRPPVLGKSAMVVTAQHLASDIGNNILQEGGNAIDAAVAVGYALSVVHPCCGNIGGGGFMLIRFANGKTTFINFREKAPLAFDQKHFNQGLHNTYPYLEVATPGTVMGLNTALKKYGKLPRARVMQPAIELAEKGYTLSQQGAEYLSLVDESLKNQANTCKTFTKNNKILRAGDTVIQQDLSRTLSQIAKGGSDAFYHGSIAKQLVKASKANRGLLTLDDFRQYTAQELAPVECDYRGYHIITAPPPSAGGITLCEILHITEHYPLSQFGFHSSKSTHYTVEAMRHAFADRNQFLGDPDFVDNPTEKLISKAHSKRIQQRIHPDRATDSHTLGFIGNTKEKPNTTGYVVVDQKGNAVSVTYTLNGFFGAQRIAGNTGFFLNNEMDDFNLQPGVANDFGLVQGDANRGAPGKRPLSSMAPTIITQNGKLFMVLSTPGGSTIPTQLANVIHNVIDYGMNIQEAIDAPRIHMQWLPDVIFFEPRAFSADTQRILNNMGHHFRPGAPWGAPLWGAVTAIQIDSKTNQLSGAMDSRRPAGSATGH